MKRTRGFALLWAMLLVIAVGSMTSVVLTRDRTVRQGAHVDARALASFHAAEGGLARARHALAKDAGFTGVTFPLDACTVTVQVERKGDASWRVVSQATPGAARIEAECIRTAGLPAIQAWLQTR